MTGLKQIGSIINKFKPRTYTVGIILDNHEPVGYVFINASNGDVDIEKGTTLNSGTTYTITATYVYNKA